MNPQRGIVPGRVARGRPSPCARAWKRVNAAGGNLYDGGPRYYAWALWQVPPRTLADGLDLVSHAQASCSSRPPDGEIDLPSDLHATGQSMTRRLPRRRGSEPRRFRRDRAAPRGRRARERPLRRVVIDLRTGRDEPRAGPGARLFRRRPNACPRTHQARRSARRWAAPSRCARGVPHHAQRGGTRGGRGAAKSTGTTG